MLKKNLKLFFLLLIFPIFLSACTLNWPWNKKVAPSVQNQPVSVKPAATSTEVVLTKQLKKFIDNNDLKIFLQSHNSTNNYSSNESVDFASSSPFVDYRADSRSSSSPDIIKIFNNYSYSLTHNELEITKIHPSNEAKVVSKISFKSKPQGVLVSGNSLIVYGLDDNINSESFYKKSRRQNFFTFLKVFDVSDPASPVLVRDLDFEGVYSSARSIGDYVYFLTNTPGSYLDGESLLPRVLSNGEILAPICSSNNSCFAPTVYYFDIAYSSFNFINITAVNIKDNNEPINGQVYLLDNNQDVYVSPTDVFMTYNSGVDEFSLEQASKKELVLPKLSSAEKDQISKIESEPDFVLNSNEKKFKIGIIIDNYLNSLGSVEKESLQSAIDENVKQKIDLKSKEASKTSIYRFAMGDKFSYEAIGEVNGKIIDQYSMDQNDDYFRIATILSANALTGSDGSSSFYSNLYILDKNLKPIGSLENLATTNLISAARFMGNRAYLSTAKFDDPLYIVSLAEINKPTILGAVKVPETYQYLLPFDPDGNKIISFGKVDSDNGADASVDQGIKLSLFDFTDLQKPKELDNYIIGNQLSDSIALTDSAALSYFYSDNKKLLIVPASLQDKGGLTFNGGIVFSLVDDHFSIKGKIDHSYAGHFASNDFINGSNYFNSTVKRGFYSDDAEDLLYTFSDKLVKINKLSDSSSVRDVILTPGSDDYIITQPAGNTAQTPPSTNNNQSATPSSTPPGVDALPGQSSSSTAPVI